MAKWTKEQEIYALRSKRKGYSIKKIGKLMKKRYGVDSILFTIRYRNSKKRKLLFPK